MRTILTNGHRLRLHRASGYIKSLLVWSAVVVAYYLWFQGFYNKIAYGKVIPYASIDEGKTAVAHNFIPIALIFAFNYMVVFVFTKRITRISVKICVDVAGYTVNANDYNEYYKNLVVCFDANGKAVWTK